MTTTELEVKTSTALSADKIEQLVRAVTLELKSNLMKLRDELDCLLKTIDEQELGLCHSIGGYGDFAQSTWDTEKICTDALATLRKRCEALLSPRTIEPQLPKVETDPILAKYAPKKKVAEAVS